MGGELRVLEGLNPLSPPSNLHRLQCLWSLCSLTFSWEHADCWTSHLEWCWSYCRRNSYKNKKIPFLRNTSVKYSCNPSHTHPYKIRPGLLLFNSFSPQCTYFYIKKLLCYTIYCSFLKKNNENIVLQVPRMYICISTCIDLLLVVKVHLC